MKHSLIYIVVVIVIIIVNGFVLDTSASGQITSTATASATLVQPINLDKVRDLSFGKIASSETSGTVVLDPIASSTRTASGGVTLPAGTSTVQSAKFIVSGADGNTYSIILPSAATTLSNGTNFMTVDNFTSTPSGSATLNSGSQIIYVGATLNVNAYQEAGDYISTQDFEVTVNYN